MKIIQTDRTLQLHCSSQQITRRRRKKKEKSRNPKLSQLRLPLSRCTRRHPIFLRRYPLLFPENAQLGRLAEVGGCWSGSSIWRRGSPGSDSHVSAIRVSLHPFRLIFRRLVAGPRSRCRWIFRGPIMPHTMEKRDRPVGKGEREKE